MLPWLPSGVDSGPGGRAVWSGGTRTPLGHRRRAGGVCAVAGVALAVPAMAPRGQGHGDPTGSLVLPLRFLNWMG